MLRTWLQLVLPSAGLVAASEDPIMLSASYVAYPGGVSPNETPAKFVMRPGESKEDGCLRCCSEGFNQRDRRLNGRDMKSICAFPGTDSSLDECNVKCGEVYPLPPMKSTFSFVQVKARTKAKIIHEAFESLEQRDKKNAATSSAIADSANKALATLSNQAKGNANLEAVMKALQAAQNGEAAASEEAKAAEKDDSKFAAASKAQESKFDATMSKVDFNAAAVDSISAVEAPASVFLPKK
eukprot:gnl/MRDRNA2_/MRDRNA2_120238_c0_seq1.p1 gnl/MRDRNA2_/MRDRNA2_120238_c0~~gnl/MRDRNA2_/MRDRNA2_120238_c0_seq1.p1  ORF type:complete len:240 (+),score=60.97 gnl/MRDRNA2_/MRDRNA2_120238_c0_seq1:90-809(+)